MEVLKALQQGSNQPMTFSTVSSLLIFWRHNNKAFSSTSSNTSWQVKKTSGVVIPEHWEHKSIWFAISFPCFCQTYKNQNSLSITLCGAPIMQYANLWCFPTEQLYAPTHNPPFFIKWNFKETAHKIEAPSATVN